MVYLYGLFVAHSMLASSLYCGGHFLTLLSYHDPSEYFLEEIFTLAHTFPCPVGQLPSCLQRKVATHTKVAPGLCACGVWGDLVINSYYTTRTLGTTSIYTLIYGSLAKPLAIAIYAT